MSSPDQTRDYGENEYDSDSPHKDNEWHSRQPKAKALKKAKLNKTQRTTGKWLKEAAKSIRKPNESYLSHLKRLSK